MASDVFYKACWQKTNEMLPGWIVREIMKAARASTGGIVRAMNMDALKLEQGIEKSFSCEFLHKQEEQQLVYGVVLEPDSIDAQNDTISAAEIEKACHWYMQNSQTVGNGHRAKADASVVESYIAPVDFEMNGQQVRKGSWIMAVHIKDYYLWEAVKSGEITGFSIGGYGVREEA